MNDLEKTKEELLKALLELHQENEFLKVSHKNDLAVLKRTADLFKSQFENSPDILLIIDRNFKIELINRSISNGLKLKKYLGGNTCQ